MLVSFFEKCDERISWNYLPIILYLVPFYPGPPSTLTMRSLALPSILMAHCIICLTLAYDPQLCTSHWLCRCPLHITLTNGLSIVFSPPGPCLLLHSFQPGPPSTLTMRSLALPFILMTRCIICLTLVYGPLPIILYLVPFYPLCAQF